MKNTKSTTTKRAVKPATKSKNSEAESPEVKRHTWWHLPAVIISAVFAALAAFLSNLQHLSDFSILLESTISRRVFATAFLVPSIRSAIGRRGLREHYPHNEQYPHDDVCFVSAKAMSLDGESAKADLVVFFNRAHDLKCTKAEPHDENTEGVAVFHREGVREHFVGDVPLPSHSPLISYEIVGPAIIRELANSENHPEIDVYMYWNDRLQPVGELDTVTADTYEGTTYIAIDNGSGALAFNNSGIFEIHFNRSHKGVIERVSAKRLQQEMKGVHLLSYNASEGIEFDGSSLGEVQADDDTDDDVADDTIGNKIKAAKPARPEEHNVFSAVVPPGDRLYLVGCDVKSGFIKDTVYPVLLFPTLQLIR
jgi:hypothetical protein